MEDSVMIMAMDGPPLPNSVQRDDQPRVVERDDAHNKTTNVWRTQ
jgi:hypothetical protein